MATPVKRITGTDIPDDMFCAVEINGTLIGYAKSEAEADNYINAYGDDNAFQRLMQNKKNKIVVATSMPTSDQVADVKQSLRRTSVLQSVFDTTLKNRVQAGSAPNIRNITWEEHTKMYAEYRDAVAHGEEKDFAYQPLAAYAHKLVRPDGREIRPVFVNECGVFTSRDGYSYICILKDQGPGDMGEKYFQVPASVEPEKP